MLKRSKSEKVPAEIQARFDEIVALTDSFCDKYLNDEYRALSRQLAATLARKRLSPLTSSRATSWAGGIIHALGMVNFLFDKSQPPHVRSSEIFEYFGISESNCQAKSKQIRDLLNIHQMDVAWCLPSRLDRNPLAWMITVNGFIVDARYVSREVQEEAARRGLIPYLPD